MTALIDLSRYPIDQPGRALDRVVSQVRAELAEDGCAVLPGFLTEAGIAALTTEAEAAAPQAHRSFNRTNPYFTQDVPSLPAGHPIRRFYDRSNAFIAADNFAPNGPLRQVHDTPGFDHFIQTCLEEEHFYRYADPLADVIVNMAEEGNGFPWHFDTNNFTVTLAIQNGEAGGDFEYAPWIRTSEDENFDAVKAVLDGTSDRVETLVLKPGDLQIFKGRYALHRVTPVKGARRRYVGIFSFVDTPGMCGSVERTKQLYGRVLQHHLDRAGHRSDALID